MTNNSSQLTSEDFSQLERLEPKIAIRGAEGLVLLNEQRRVIDEAERIVDASICASVPAKIAHAAMSENRSDYGLAA